MTTFTVIWATRYDAEDENDAVIQAFGEMQDPNTTATYFRVINEDKQTEIFADFQEILDPGRYKS